MQMNSEKLAHRIATSQDSPEAGEALRSAAAIDVIQSRSRYFFEADEFATLTAREPDSISTRSALRRLAEKGQIVSIARQPSGWLIIPPEFAHYGAPPVAWWLHDFVSRFEPHYYVALLSAARHWGSSHYALQETQVMLSVPRRPLKAGKNKIVFFTKSEPAPTPVVEVSAQVAQLRVSTREATLLDLVRYQTKIGGMEAIARIARDFNQAMTGSGLFAALDAMNNISCAQRLGFVLDMLDLRIHANVVESWLQGKHRSVLPLSTGEAAGREMQISHRWYIRYNDHDLTHMKEQL